MNSWRTRGLWLVLLAATSTGCCYDCGTGYWGSPLGFAGPGPFVEPNCGIAAACEPDRGIAGYVQPAYVEPVCEPDCGIAGPCDPCGPVGCLEPACGIEPDCGIAGPCDPCGGCGTFGGYGGGYGGCGQWPYGYGLFGLFNGWGPDWEVMCKGWNPCLGPFEALANAFHRCNWGCGGWGWGWGGCCGAPSAGCGGRYWDEWISDPPRCCDPCPDLCASTGYGHGGGSFGGGCGVGCGSGCGGGCGGGCSGGVCSTKPVRRNASYAQNFHPWPRRPANYQGNAHRVVASGRAPARSPVQQRSCNCAKCQMQRNVARRPMNPRVRQVNYQR